MNSQQLRRAVLEQIAAHDGQWYWYQLDRAVVSNHPHLSRAMLSAVKELDARGFIRITPHPQRADLEVYWITDEGRLVMSAADSRQAADDRET